MALLAAAVVVVGIIGLLNLLFTFGVVRRLREHTEALNGLERPSATVMLEPGKTVVDFTAVTVTGEPTSLDSLNRAGSPALVGFFSPNCPPCETKLPAFVEYARQYPGGQSRVLAVVVGDDDEAASKFVNALGETAGVVRDIRGGPVYKAFGVRGTPAFALVDASGAVLASGSEVSEVSAATVKV
jgi:thiol-disulfide isomerase/thioredoxin